MTALDAGRPRGLAGAVPGGREPVHRAVWLATVALGALLVLWSVAVPAYRAPDEPQHLSTALRVADGGGYPPPGSARLQHEVAASYPFADFPGGDYRTFVPRHTITRPNGHWPSFATLRGAPAPVGQVDQVDQMTQHPPLWAYLTAGEIQLFHLRDIPAGLALVLLRLLQGLWLLPIPWLCWRTARLLGARGRAAATVAFLPLAAPQFLHIGASVTNGNLQVLEFALAAPLLVKVALGDRTRRTAGLLGVTTALALLTKVFGVLLLPVILLAYAARAREDLRAAVRAAVTALGTAVAIGGWWYVVQYVHTGALQPSGYPPAVLKLFKGHQSPQHAWALMWQGLLRTTWCDLAWFETPARMRLVGPVLGVAVLALLWALVRGRADRRAVGISLLPLGLLVVVVIGTAWTSWGSLHAVYGVQGRYLFAAVAGVGGVLALAFDAPGPLVARRVLSGLAPVGVLVSQGLGLHLAIQYFWTAGHGGSLHTALLASPFSGWYWVAAGVAAVAALLASVVALAGREAGATPPRPPAHEALPAGPDADAVAPGSTGPREVRVPG